MGRIFVISDLHFSHKNMALKRGFNSIEEHDNYIIERWNSVVNKKDTVWILGDITMEKSGPYHLLDKLKGFKKVVLGNHDEPQHVTALLKHVNKVCSCFEVRGKGVMLTHIPIHPQELQYRFRKNIHGHLHENKVMKTIEQEIDSKVNDLMFETFTTEVEDERYVNVSCECVDYTPVCIDTLI